MNHYDAREIMRRHADGLPIGYGSVDEAQAFLNTHPISKPRAAAPVPEPFVKVHQPEVIPPRQPRPRAILTTSGPVVTFAQAPPPMEALCVCRARYGQHRVNDYACPNQQWKPGNGQPQWQAKTWLRQ